jgi:hypothetical protein
MHIRFRKTYKIFPGVKINISRHGISTSVGPRGMHLTFNKYGVRQSVGLPGSGLSETSYLVKNRSSDKNKSSDEQAADAHHHIHNDEGMGCELEGCGCLFAILLIAGIAVYFGANSLHLIPANYLSHLLQLLTEWLHKAGF